MNVDDELYTTLSADTGVTALVGTRLYPTPTAANPERPYVVWHRISSDRDQTHDDADYYRSLFQINVFADSLAEADQAADAIHQAIQNNTPGDAASLEARRVTYEPQSQLHGAELDIVIWHQN